MTTTTSRRFALVRLCGADEPSTSLIVQAAELIRSKCSTISVCGEAFLCVARRRGSGPLRLWTWPARANCWCTSSWQMPTPRRKRVRRPSSKVWMRRVYRSISAIHNASTWPIILPMSSWSSNARIDSAMRKILRVPRPRGRAITRDQVVVKPVPEGTDDWTHPYHGPDNNPLSQDTHITARYMTQFLADLRMALRHKWPWRPAGESSKRTAMSRGTNARNRFSIHSLPTTVTTGPCCGSTNCPRA